VVERSPLKIVSDRRGSLAELFRGDWGQVNVVEVSPGALRGCHRHNKTNEAWAFLYGMGVLYMEGEHGTVERIDVSRGDHIFLPAGTGHAIRNTGPELLVFVYYMDHMYNQENPDKEPWLVEELFT